MSTTTMTRAEREEFLAGLHVGVLSVARAGRAPLTVPIWYAYTPGEDVWVWTEHGTVKEKLIREAGQFSLVAQQEELPYKYVGVEGPATFVECPSLADVRPMVERYLPADAVDPYLEQMFDDRALIIRMQPQHWLSGDYAKAGF